MYSRVSTLIVTGCVVLAFVGPSARVGEAQVPRAILESVYPPRVLGDYYPTQLVPGQTNVLHVATGAQNQIQSIEITPSTGITVTGMKARNLGQGAAWWEFTIAVAKDAAPGPRMLVAQMATGVRTAPGTLTIPNHLPGISGLRVLSAQMNQPTVDLQLTATNQGGTFGDSPYVWFDLRCGPGQPEAGVVRGKFAADTIRVSIPNPHTFAGRAGAPAAGSHCDLQVRVTDSSGTDSNTAKTTVDFK
jgi:hypothetical protein